MVLLPRVSILTLILETRPGKQEWLGKHWIPSYSQQCVWLEELLTVSQFKKSLMNAVQFTMTYIESKFSPWQLLLGTTPTDKSVCENVDLAQCSVEVVDEAAKQRLRVKEESYKAYIEERSCHSENVAKRFMKPDLGGIGQQVNGAGIGGLANARVRECLVVFFSGRHVCCFKNEKPPLKAFV